MPLLWMFIAIPINYWLIGINWYGMFVVFIPVYAFLFLPVRMVIAGDTQGFLRYASQHHWSLMTTVFAFSHVAFLLVLPDDGKQTGALLVLFLVGLTEFNDIAQYLWGKSMGRIKVIPKVSPNKTGGTGWRRGNHHACGGGAGPAHDTVKHTDGDAGRAYYRHQRLLWRCGDVGH